MQTELLETLEEIHSVLPPAPEQGATESVEEASGAHPQNLAERVGSARQTLDRLMPLSGSVRLAEFSRRFVGRELFEKETSDGYLVPTSSEPAEIVVAEISRLEAFAESRIDQLQSAARRRAIRAERTSKEVGDRHGLQVSEQDLVGFAGQLDSLNALDAAKPRRKPTLLQDIAYRLAQRFDEPVTDLLFRNLKSVRGEVQAMRDEVGQTLINLGGAFQSLNALDLVFQSAIAGRTSQLLVNSIGAGTRCLEVQLLESLQGCDTGSEVVAKISLWFRKGGVLETHQRQMLDLGRSLFALETKGIENLLAVAAEYAAALAAAREEHGVQHARPA